MERAGELRFPLVSTAGQEARRSGEDSSQGDNTPPPQVLAVFPSSGLETPGSQLSESPWGRDRNPALAMAAVFVGFAGNAWRFIFRSVG